MSTQDNVTAMGSQPDSSRSQTTRFPIGQAIGFLVLLLFALFWLLPFAWAVATSLKPEAETTDVPLEWIASTVTLDAYRETLETGNLQRWFLNSVITSVLITLLTLLISSLAAFGFSRLRFRLRKPLLWLVLGGIMVPGQVLIVPLFDMMAQLRLVDTYWGIILPQLASPIAVFVLKQFFDGIPHELEEAAVIDGASPFRVWWQIWMPLAVPILSALAILTFVWSWNNFLWPFIVVTDTSMMTIPVGLATVQSSYGIVYAQIMAAAVLGGLPLLIVFVLFQRRIVEGVAGVGIKG